MELTLIQNPRKNGSGPRTNFDLIKFIFKIKVNIKSRHVYGSGWSWPGSWSYLPGNTLIRIWLSKKKRIRILSSKKNPDPDPTLFRLYKTNFFLRFKRIRLELIRIHPPRRNWIQIRPSRNTRIQPDPNLQPWCKHRNIKISLRSFCQSPRFICETTRTISARVSLNCSTPKIK